MECHNDNTFGHSSASPWENTPVWSIPREEHGKSNIIEAASPYTFWFTLGLAVMKQALWLQGTQEKYNADIYNTHQNFVTSYNDMCVTNAQYSPRDAFRGLLKHSFMHWLPLLKSSAQSSKQEFIHFIYLVLNTTKNLGHRLSALQFAMCSK